MFYYALRPDNDQPKRRRRRSKKPKLVIILEPAREAFLISKGKFYTLHVCPLRNTDLLDVDELIYRQTPEGHLRPYWKS